jgi:hypothetical protein
MRNYKVFRIGYCRFIPMKRQNAKEELDGPAVSALGVRSRKLSNFFNGQS